MLYFNIMFHDCQYTSPNTHFLLTPTLFDRQSTSILPCRLRVMWLWEVKELTRPRTNAFEAQPDAAAPTIAQTPNNAGKSH